MNRLAKPILQPGRICRGAAAQTCCFFMLLALHCLNSPAAATPEPLKSFHLPDQFGKERQCDFPAQKPTVLIIADKQGSEHIAGWVAPLKQRYQSRLAIEGIADVSKVPAPLRALVRQRLKKTLDHPVMLDWHGTVISHFKLSAGVPNVFVLSTKGETLFSVQAPANAAHLESLCKVLDGALERGP